MLRPRPFRGHRWFFALAALGAAVSCASFSRPSLAQPPAASPPQPLNADDPNLDSDSPDAQRIIRPAASGRVVKFFDFEERANPDRPDFNPETVPRGWIRAQSDPPHRERPGFPVGNKAAYSTAVAHSGTVSVHLPTNGGSTSLRYGANLLPVFPGADYLVSAYIRTGPLEHAAAFLEARFVDQFGRPIEGSNLRSKPVRSEGEWTFVALTLVGRHDQAAFLQIELLLLQPEQYEADARTVSRHHVWDQDLHADAWFDDVGVVQLPRVTLETDRPSNIHFAPHAPVFSALIRDLTGEDMTAELTLTDVDDAVVAHETRKVFAGGGQFTWSPPIPRLGWYRAEMNVLSGATPVGSAHCHVLYLAPRLPGVPAEGQVPAPTSEQAARFALTIDTLEPWQTPIITGIVSDTGVGAITLPLRGVGDPHAAQPQSLADFRALLDRLLAAHLDVTLAIRRFDPALAAELRVDPLDPLALVTKDEKTWLPSIRSVLDIYGQRIRRWQIGSLDSDAILNASLASDLKAFRAALTRMVPGPVLSVPYRAEWPWPADCFASVDGLDMTLPDSFPAASVPGALALWGERSAKLKPPPDLSVTIQTPDAEDFGRRAALIDLMQRTIMLWTQVASGGVDTTRDPSADPATRPAAPTPTISHLSITQPWTTIPGAHPEFLPEPTLGAWRTLTEHLASRKVLGPLPVPAGLRCFLLADADQGSTQTRRPGAIVLWNESAAPDAIVSAYLGLGRVTLVDAFGNTQHLDPVDAAGLYRIPASPTPVFVEGVEPELTLFVSQFRVVPEFVPAVAAEHEHELVLTNPWPVRISGDVQLIQPPGAGARHTWKFRPTAPMSFTIAPGATQRIPFSFTFSSNEDAGSKALGVLVRLSAEKIYPPFKIGAPITVGLTDLDLNPSIILGPTSDGPDVIVIANVTNAGAAPRTLQVHVQAPGQPQQQQPISNLGPGDTAVRRFVFRGGASALSTQRIHVSLFDVDGAERLNKSVVVP